ncbi:decarboxylating 6-phosphogluconate dehydrogenase [Candidatus Woesearchaeota archaeon]|nr:decarboxylating 6-phosphogluconate dehydrogenase [Candidatus Woesearchaeota archaeon]MCF7901403.1 decarboxylating 6-phosphogluconate dehydrogenase [Candidatus Woesearchaeota archaeon]MCF8013723.1 decarboxylating 6-phosphogluconate dehydrogenase [Candidatus Woesearchaeota archaeon]
MKLGFVGLGKMGYHMVERLLEKGHEVVVYNRSPEKVQKISEEKGAIPSTSYEDFVKKLDSPKIIWMMVPHKTVDEVKNQILPYLEKGDLLIDGGNSRYTETIRRANELKEKGINYFDVGVSGGLAAAKTGYCMMSGGEETDFKKIEPIIKDMCVPNGYGYFGTNGAGHYVKMIHNGIEYGMMQAIGEGFNVIKEGPFKEINMLKLSNVWNNGSIIQGKLIEWTKDGFEHHPGMEDVDGFVPHSGEGQWTVEDAEKYNVEIPIIKRSLEIRKESENKKTFATKIVSVLRDEFGGHGIKKKEE